MAITANVTNGKLDKYHSDTKQKNKQCKSKWLKSWL